MNKSVEYLDFLANHFAPRDWDYTRKTDIDHIRYSLKNDPTQKFNYRIKHAFGWMFASKKRGWLYDNSLRMRVYMFLSALKKEKHLPDGCLDGGNVITHWEETGEYLQMVQPSVGALLVDFLKECPEHPHAKIIIKELNRIQKRYRKRIKSRECGI